MIHPRAVAILGHHVARSSREVNCAQRRHPRHIRRREKLRHIPRHRVNAIRRNDIPRKWRANKSGARRIHSRRRRIVNGHRVAIRQPRLAEIARQHPRIRQRSGERNALNKSHNLRIHKEKRLVLAVVEFWNHHRPANRSAKLVEPERRPLRAAAIGEKVIRVQLVIAEKLIRAEVELIRPALGDDIEHAARRPPIFRRKIIRFHLELLHHVRVRIDHRLILRRRRIRRAIQQEFIRRRPLPIDRIRDGRNLIDHQSIHARRRPHPRNQHRQRVRVPPQQRQFHHLLVADHLAQRRTLALQHQRLRRYFDPLRHRAHLQHHVQPRRLLHRQLQTHLPRRHKSIPANLDVVPPRRQRGRRVISVLIRRDGRRHSRSHGPHRHPRVGHHRPARIGDPSRQRCRLRIQGNRHQSTHQNPQKHGLDISRYSCRFWEVSSLLAVFCG